MVICGARGRLSEYHSRLTAQATKQACTHMVLNNRPNVWTTSLHADHIKKMRSGNKCMHKYAKFATRFRSLRICNWADHSRQFEHFHAEHSCQCHFLGQSHFRRKPKPLLLRFCYQRSSGISIAETPLTDASPLRHAGLIVAASLRIDRHLNGHAPCHVNQCQLQTGRDIGHVSTVHGV
ncbi:hypothetical protein BaRGS_00014441 [Batillaria attramentaria]|uniref:Uncharacterized protein n=1 Tax=Batillaria attramentaria TaxID=370345 RepID=A0ABD0L4W8_9CAEN